MISLSNINNFILKKEDKTLSSLFSLSSSSILSISHIPIEQVLEPFNTLLGLQLEYYKSRDIKYINDMLEYIINNYNSTAIKYLDDNCPSVLKIILNNYYFNFKSKYSTHTAIKILSEINKILNIKLRITDYILSLYISINNYKMANTYLTINSKIENNRYTSNKDIYIFNYLSYIIKYYNDDFIGAYSHIIKLDTKIEIEYKIVIIKYLLGCKRNKRLDAFKNKNISVFDKKMIDVYFPLLNFRDILKIIFYNFNEEYRLDINYIIAYYKLYDSYNIISLEEIISMIISLIENEYIKGYISINKNVIVFSRKEPFVNKIRRLSIL